MYTREELTKLLEEADGAAYIVDMDSFRQNVHDFLAAFRYYYTNTNLGYSYKTNYLPALAVEAGRLGLYAEVVSGMEYEIAVACGNSLDRIIFNGPVKTEKELKTALFGNTLVNIDSLDEVTKIINICNHYPDRYFTVGLRCHFQITDQWESRFGLNASDGQLDRAFEQISNLPNCRINGLHCHFSKDRSALSYHTRAEQMLKFVNRYFPDDPPMYLDLGGGFCGHMPESLRQQFGNSPTYEDYAAEIGPLVAERFGKDGQTELILEPGIGIIGDVMKFACTVVSVKQLPDRTVAVTTGSYQNIKPRISSFNLPIKIYSDQPNKTVSKEQRVDLVGYTCMEDDVLYYGCPTSVSVGDVIVFNNIGAYSLVFKPPFIRTMPPVVTRDEETWVYLRQRETAHELLKQYIF
jgi:diaminopimelate decarboxylase